MSSRFAFGQKVLSAALAMRLLAAYAFAASGPLRAAVPTAGAFDMGGYVQWTQWVLDGAPSNLHEVAPASRYFPAGFPCLIAMLRICGLATPRGLMTLNLISLAIGLWAAGRLLRRTFLIPAEAVGW